MEHKFKTNIFHSTDGIDARNPFLQDDNSSTDARAGTGAHAHGLHALADICMMKQREELVQEPQFSSDGQNIQVSSFTQAREETEQFPEEVLRTLCLMRNSSADLKRLLAIPAEDERTDNRQFANSVETRREGPIQAQKQSNKASDGKRLDRELEKMLK
jgi:hypothetical protein